MIKYLSVYFLTRFIKVFPSRKVLHFDVSKITCLWVNGGFGEFILKGLQVLCTRHAVLSFRKHTDDAITVGRGSIVWVSHETNYCVCSSENLHQVV